MATDYSCLHQCSSDIEDATATHTALSSGSAGEFEWLTPPSRTAVK